MTKKQKTLMGDQVENIFQQSDNTTDDKSVKYLRTIVNLQERVPVHVPRNNPHRRLLDYGILPGGTYTLDVYLQIAELFSHGKSPDQIVDYLRDTYTSLQESRISRGFVKKSLQLTSAVLLPEMIRLVPDDGEWTLMIDGTVRSKEDSVLVVIVAVSSTSSTSSASSASSASSNLMVIPLIATFLPSENTNDIQQLLFDLKPRLPSMPKSVISDFRAGMLEAIAEIFPDSISQGCHYHMIDMIAKILINPIIMQIRKKINTQANGLIRWAHHSIYGKQSDNLILFARSIKKLSTSKSGKFGENFLQFCKKMLQIVEWVCRRKDLLHSNQNYRELVKLLSKDIWKEIVPHLSQLEFVLKEFNQLRKCLTMLEYKTALEPAPEDVTPVAPDAPVGNAKYDFVGYTTFELDQLMDEWIKLGAISKHDFNKRFKKAVNKLHNHYLLIKPAIIDPTLPRTTSPLENLFSQVKHMLRKWSGTKQVRRPFEWASQLATISRSLKDTELFEELLRDVTSYDWIEHSIRLGRELSKYRREVRFANSVANMSPLGVVRILDNLAIRDITG